MNIRSPYCVLVLLVLTSLSTAQAGNLTLMPGGSLEWKGPIEPGDLDQFKKLVEQSGGIRSLSLVDSRGGDVVVARALQDYVYEKRVPVSVSGGCVSGCALIFLASNKRTIRSSMFKITYLHLHGSYRVSDGAYVNLMLDNEIVRLRENTKGKFPIDLYRRARTVRNKKGGLFIFDKAWHLSSGDSFVAFCTGEERAIPRDCEGFKEMSAQSLGIVDEKN